MRCVPRAGGASCRRQRWTHDLRIDRKRNRRSSGCSFEAKRTAIGQALRAGARRPGTRRNPARGLSSGSCFAEPTKATRAFRGPTRRRPMSSQANQLSGQSASPKRLLCMPKRTKSSACDSKPNFRSRAEQISCSWPKSSRYSARMEEHIPIRRGLREFSRCYPRPMWCFLSSNHLRPTLSPR